MKLLEEHIGIEGDDVSLDKGLSDDEYTMLLEFFDADFYLQQTMDDSASDNPVAHYLNEGWQQGMDPHPDFSSKYYLERSPDVRSAGLNPYLHYIKQGRKEGRLPSPNFRGIDKSSGHSPDTVGLIRQNFDQEMYLSNDDSLSRCNVDPVLHYLSFGWVEGRNPSKLFSTDYYLSQNKDVRDSGINPFEHYLRWGRNEGRKGSAEEKLKRYSKWVDNSKAREIYELQFDVDYYSEQKPAIEGTDICPYLHYKSFGWKEGLNPSREFSTDFYKKNQQGINFNQRDPFSDYLHDGVLLGAIPRPVHPVLIATDQEARLLMQKKLVGDLFDAEFYLNCSPDLQMSGVDPFEHYLLHGYSESRDPAPWFSVSYYKGAYPRSSLYNIDPLTHYVIWGRSQGFKTHPSLPSQEQSTSLYKPSCIKDTMLLSALPLKSDVTAKPLTDYDSKKLDMHLVIPNFGIGGGGHMTIFRMVHWLEYFGHKCTIWINTEEPINPDNRYDDVLKYYQFIKAEIRSVSTELLETQGDALIATSWDTAALVDKATGFKERFYFVQDYEPLFYARGSRGVLAEQTYSLDLACICASPWLRHVLETQHGRWARDFYLSYSPEFYYPGPSLDRKNAIPRIAVYSRIGTERRCVELALLALEHLSQQGFEFHADIFGVDQPFENLSFLSTFHGVLSSEELGALYRSCDIGLCFSATNYSLVPQEMMACGLPVIELDVESATFSIAKEAAYFTAPTPDKIAESIITLVEDTEKRLELAQSGQNWAAKTSWEKAAKAVEAALLERISEGGWKDHARKAPAIIKQEPIKASVIIPTLNGGELFDELLDRIESQKVEWPFELVVVDSGSSDDTVHNTRKLPNAKVVEIPKSEFQHGRTRNLGVTHSSGEYVLFLTQDALPADDFWLYNFVSTMDKFPEAAGGFGKHFAHKDASFMNKKLMREHFSGFDQFPLLVSKYTDLPKWNSGDQGWRSLLHFYSDNNSCMRRSVWEDLPYPEVTYGEDQLWAQQVMLSGMSKVYCPNAIILHSHEYDYDENMERAEIEAWFFRKYFGYDLTVTEIDKEIALRNAQAERLGIQYGLSREEIEQSKRNGVAQLLGWQLGSKRGSLEEYKIDLGECNSPNLFDRLSKVLCDSK